MTIDCAKDCSLAAPLAGESCEPIPPLALIRTFAFPTLGQRERDQLSARAPLLSQALAGLFSPMRQFGRRRAGFMYL